MLTTENKWLAARHGLDAPLIDLATGSTERVPVRELVRRTLAGLTPHARELGAERELEAIEAILARGNGADEQLRTWAATRDLGAVVAEFADASAAGLAP
jgi:carboxylate-amine ligase